MGRLTRLAVLAGTVAGGCCALVAPAHAEGSDWRHTVVIYGMGAAIDGTAQFGDVAVPVDVSIAELFDALEMGAMGAYRIANDTWSVTVDATYMGLGGTSESDHGRIKGDMDLDQVTLMGTLGRRVGEHTELLFSLAYVDLSTELEVTTRHPLTGAVIRREAGEDASWVDPLVGLQFNWPLATDWRANLRGDIGGFGIGSDLTWQMLASVHWQAGERVGLVCGYRVISFDYEDGDGSDYERYDLVEQGPLLGVTISF